MVTNFDPERARLPWRRAHAPYHLVTDDFDDFQAAPTPSPTRALQPAASANLFDMLDAPSSVPAPRQTQPQGMSMGAFTSPPAYAGNGMGGMGGGMEMGMAVTPAPAPARPNYTSTPSASAKPAAAAPSKGGFDDLWTSSLTSFSGAAPAASGTQAGKSIKELEREKMQASLWGGGGQQGGQQKTPVKPTMGAFDDLLG